MCLHMISRANRQPVQLPISYQTPSECIKKNKHLPPSISLNTKPYLHVTRPLYIVAIVQFAKYVEVFHYNSPPPCSTKIDIHHTALVAARYILQELEATGSEFHLCQSLRTEALGTHFQFLSLEATAGRR